MIMMLGDKTKYDEMVGKVSPVVKTSDDTANQILLEILRELRTQRKERDMRDMFSRKGDMNDI